MTKKAAVKHFKECNMNTKKTGAPEPHDADAKLLESMGYQQDLHRRMSKC